MARTALTVQEITRNGLSPAYTAANGDGHSVALDGQNRTMIHVVNGDASPNVVTLQTSATVDGEAVADKTVNVPAGEERMIGPFPNQFYRQSDGSVYIDHSNTTSNTIAAFNIPAE